jgi:hypothetical protein
MTVDVEPDWSSKRTAFPEAFANSASLWPKNCLRRMLAKLFELEICYSKLCDAQPVEERVWLVRLSEDIIEGTK